MSTVWASEPRVAVQALCYTTMTSILHYEIDCATPPYFTNSKYEQLTISRIYLLFPIFQAL